MTTDYPSPEIDTVELVDVLRALADPDRLHIVRILADGEPHAKNVAEWGLDQQKSALSYHFKELRLAGVTNTIVKGRKHWIQLRREELDARFPGLIAALIASSSQPPG